MNESEEHLRLRKTSAKLKTKTHREKKKELEKKQLRKEYRWYAVAIGSLLALLLAYVRHLTATDLGKADGYWKAGMHWQMEERQLAKAKDCYLKAMQFTDYCYPKYLHDFARFLIPPHSYRPPAVATEEDVYDITEAETWCRRAIKLHQTNAIYHRTLTEILERMVEDGAVYRKAESLQQRERTVIAHISEANFFLGGGDTENEASMALAASKSKSGKLKQYLFGKKRRKDDTEKAIMKEMNDKNWRAAKMHMDYAIAFAGDDVTLKAKAFEVAARSFWKNGFVDVCMEYWSKGQSAEVGSCELQRLVTEKYAVFLYEMQDYSKALSVLEQLLSDESQNESENVVALTFKAKILSDLERFDEALALFSRLMVAAPMTQLIPIEMALVLIETQRFAEALEMLNSCKDIIGQRNNAENCEPYLVRLVRCYLRMQLLSEEQSADGQYLADLNAEVFAIASEHCSDFYANYLAARYLHESGQSQLMQKADGYYRRALRIEDNWAFALFQYSRFLLQEAGDEINGKRFLKSAFTKNPHLPRLKKLYEQTFYDK